MDKERTWAVINGQLTQAIQECQLRRISRLITVAHTSTRSAGDGWPCLLGGFLAWSRRAGTREGTQMLAPSGCL